MTLCRLSLLALLTLTLDAHALYYCKCDAGAHASCVAGSDANDGSTAALARSTLPNGSALGSASAGTTHRLCEGGWWTGLSTYIVQNNNVTRTQPLTLTTYTPASGATGRPVMETTSGLEEGFVIGGFNNPTDHGGYVINGIRFRRAGTAGGEGLKLFGNARWVTYTNIMVDNWANGMLIATSQDINDIVIRNSWFGPNTQNGIIGSATDMLIEGNTFDQNNNDGTALEHGIYSGGCEPQQRVTFRRNTFLNNSTSGGVCTSGNITARGNVTGMTIEENYIEVPAGSPDCYGISVIDGYSSCTEHVDGLVIRGNTIVNVGSNSIGIRLCTNCLIENNRIIRDFANTGLHYGISIGNPGDPADVAVSPAVGAVVRNNSIYVDQQGSGAAIRISSGSSHKVLNNVVHLTANVGSANCFDHTALSNFSVWNNNWCYELGSGQWSGTYSTLSAAQAAGFDTSGGNTNPLWASTPSTSATSFATQSGSPLRNTGRNTDKAPRDASWCQRDSTPDVGAAEAGGTPCLTFRAPVEMR